MVKYQAVMAANGIICKLDGPFHGRKHDAGMLKESKLYDKLQTLTEGHKYVIYGDPAYPLKRMLFKPFGGASLAPHHTYFNREMSTVRQAVEWGFPKISNEFAYVDYKNNQKLMLQNVPTQYKAATILANCHTCMHDSQVSAYFNLDPPCLGEYLV